MKFDYLFFQIFVFEDELFVYSFIRFGQELDGLLLLWQGCCIKIVDCREQNILKSSILIVYIVRFSGRLSDYGVLMLQVRQLIILNNFKLLR